MLALSISIRLYPLPPYIRPQERVLFLEKIHVNQLFTWFFTERYEGIRHDTENDGYGSFEAERADGKRLVAVINTDLLAWDAKASHPWVVIVEISYDGEQNNGMPDKQTYELLEEIEDNILGELKDFEGYLNVGRQTADGVREIYFACNDFRKPAKVLHQIQASYSNKFAISYDIYKDKYWQSFERFAGN